VRAEKYAGARVGDVPARYCAFGLVGAYEHGLNIVNALRTQLTEAMLPSYDLVVSMVESDKQPEWLRGENLIWWDIADGEPAISGFDYKNQFDEVEKHVHELVKMEDSGGDFRELDESVNKGGDNA
jgi:hypothetical protein